MITDPDSAVSFTAKRLCGTPYNPTVSDRSKIFAMNNPIAAEGRKDELTIYNDSCLLSTNLKSLEESEATKKMLENSSLPQTK